jgi:hypothetical protein
MTSWKRFVNRLDFRTVEIKLNDYHIPDLAEANKKRYNEIAFLQKLGQAPRRRETLFENQTVSHQCPAGSRRLLPVNQRVKSAIATAEKIECDSRLKKREKRLRPLGRPSG